MSILIGNNLRINLHKILLELITRDPNVVNLFFIKIFKLYEYVVKLNYWRNDVWCGIKKIQMKIIDGSNGGSEIDLEIFNGPNKVDIYVDIPRYLCRYSRYVDIFC